MVTVEVVSIYVEVSVWLCNYMLSGAECADKCMQQVLSRVGMGQETPATNSWEWGGGGGGGQQVAVSY
jgi:hypothetical protein